jgi:N-acetyl-anhydromuramyl-L-alanine amidase AmpD
MENPPSNDSPDTSAEERRPGHGSSNEHPKPTIKQFIASPNHSSRNGTKIDTVVLHCTEASLASTLEEFQKEHGRQVSAHYVIDRIGDIYQMVDDSERANHCRGANQSSIGIEHVGRETDPLTDEQAASSAALIRWLLEQYEIPRSNVFGHDFTPDYDLPGGTSCPDKLFGSKHAQSTITAWVEENV